MRQMCFPPFSSASPEGTDGDESVEEKKTGQCRMCPGISEKSSRYNGKTEKEHCRTMKIQHSFDFDPYCGFSREELLSLRPPEQEPGDFDAFWLSVRERAMSEPLKILERRKIWSPYSGTDVFEIRCLSWDGVEIGAWVTRPADSEGGLVLGHGYGNPSTPAFRKRLTTILSCQRGMGLSKHPLIPWEPAEHVLYGISRRETYSMLGATVDLWTAVSALLELYPDTAENLHYEGGSFGGGLGALALAWENRVHSAYLNVPTFGNHRLRFRYPSTGSGEACRKYCAQHPEAFAVLDYFDASIAASRIRIPTIVSPALFDPCVVPPGQFSIANAIPEVFRTMVILPAGHFEVPENIPVREEITRLQEARLYRSGK